MDRRKIVYVRAIAIVSKICKWTPRLPDESLSITTENYMNPGNCVRHSLYYG